MFDYVFLSLYLGLTGILNPVSAQPVFKLRYHTKISSRSSCLAIQHSPSANSKKQNEALLLHLLGGKREEK